ncbi:hypothetical protein I4I73_30955 [Pseudonocardia sp. KRD-184]|uniref:Helix-turn-helix protein n=1 Tax=Pseudonocardia oceani TaxID=2792013 RepID=A0ABS6UHS4_9PSEU|nr:hypothetical protein [Pseudonocardia oceani]MBW0093767.1 hypothetical protein [Pseudonocardia oceani]MBW0100405.1 hypothetical protein [Pseudonocardia oceani]MBW0113137.1 hypothetical protein [Pseudonocardia oceani]MBW0122283.1 hypothetical protein [Pseudonocardia oceani]MBW0131791.1 hypothetical protein [Pseudonocardia oceani]
MPIPVALHDRRDDGHDAAGLRFSPGDERGVDELAGSAHTSRRTIERAS